MKREAQLTLGLIAAVALMSAAVWLWLHNVIIVAAPVGALALGVAWAGIDNAIIYPAERARREAEASPIAPDTSDKPGIASPPPFNDHDEVTVPH